MSGWMAALGFVSRRGFWGAGSSGLGGSSPGVKRIGAWRLRPEERRVGGVFPGGRCSGVSGVGSLVWLMARWVVLGSGGVGICVGIMTGLSFGAGVGCCSRSSRLSSVCRCQGAVAVAKFFACSYIAFGFGEECYGVSAVVNL